MAFNICLSYKPYPPLVAQFIPPGVIRIMGCSDVIGIALFDQLKVAYHLCLCDRMAHIRPVFGTVYLVFCS